MLNKDEMLLAIDTSISQLVLLRRMVQGYQEPRVMIYERPCTVNADGQHGPIEWDRDPETGENADTGMCRRCGDAIRVEDRPAGDSGVSDDSTAGPRS